MKLTDEEKMLWMFEQAHGKLSGNCSAEIINDHRGEAEEVACVKDGEICWSKNKLDLVFDYLTKYL